MSVTSRVWICPTSTHRSLDAYWVWAEGDVRDLVQAAGFTDVSISYIDYSGDGRLSKLLSGPALRVVHAVKQQTTPADG
jgi:hypothetical protein